MATINGTSGNDTVNSTAGVADILNGLAGNDTLYGNDLNDSLYGGDGNDSLFGGDGNDLLNGGAGNDVFDGGAGIDTLDYTGSSAGVAVNLNSGVAAIGHATGDVFTGIENLTGSSFNDQLTGNDDANVITGGALNDTIYGGLGADTLYGGTGNDTYYVDNIGDIVSEVGGDGTNDVVNSSVDYTIEAGIENLFLTGVLNIDGTGNESANTIIGNSGSGGFLGTTGDNYLSGRGGNDTIYGNDGVDTLDGGTGNDSMLGGTFNDYYIVDAAGDAVVEFTGEGVDTVESSISYTLGTFVENLILTGTSHLTGTGNAADNLMEGNDGNNSLTGDAGNDTLRGGAGDDTLNGGTGNDSMVGGTGNDVMYVDSTQDKTIEQISEGTDTVRSTINHTLAINIENLILETGATNGKGNGSANQLTGNAADNLLEGLTDNDSLYGGNGNDTLDGGSGNDSMMGGAGNDTYIVDSANDIVDETGGSGVDLIQATADVVMATGIENVQIMGSGNFDATGNTLANTMTGGSGSNALDGGDGNDSLYGNAGADTMIGGAGDDLLVGGSGNDVYYVGNGTDTMVELEDGGTDTVHYGASLTLATHFENLVLTSTSGHSLGGNAANNIITGNIGNDQIATYGGNDTLYGGDGADVLDAGEGVDSMVGGMGDDLYYVDNAGDKVIETSDGGENDIVFSSIDYELGTYTETLLLAGAAVTGVGNTKANLMEGNSIANSLDGGSGNDTLYGYGGNDTLIGGSGADSMTGGLGDDVYVVDSLLDAIIEDAGEGTDEVRASIDYTLATDFENLTLTGTSGIDATGNGVANVITGNAGANVLLGLEGNDTIYGGNGADVLNGGTGNDLMDGGAGNDVYHIDSLGDTVVELALGGIDTINTIFTTTLSSQIENGVLGGTDNLNLTGNGLANRLTGNSGNNLLSSGGSNDTLNGGDGRDTLDGGNGADSMVGGSGDDVYYVNQQSDRVTESSTGGYDIVYASSTFKMGAYVEELELSGTGDFEITGNSSANLIYGNVGNNRLTGESGSDTIHGGDGRDTIDGGAGTDSMIGGSGDDTYVVSSTADVIVELEDGGIDTVQARSNWVLGDNLEILQLMTTGGFSGTGNALNNHIAGNAGRNTLNGMDGDDLLVGAGGNDILTGGEGADMFVYEMGPAGNDVITDFNSLDGGDPEGDLLVFNGLLTGSFAYLGTSEFTATGNSEARVNEAQSLVIMDTNGDGTADIRITLTGLTTATQLTIDDFLFV